MLRYSKGLARKFAAFEQRWRFCLKRLKGKITKYPVYRPPIDHSVYEADNRLLGSTSLSEAQIIHQTSWTYPILKPALVEFEHGLALIKLPHQNDDFVEYRQAIPDKVNSFFKWFEPGIHRLLGSSAGAVQSFFELAHKHGKDVPSQACEVLKWSRFKSQSIIRPANGRLRVFHYGGWYPFAKGTHDVLALAKLFPSVDFEISVDLGHALIKSVSQPNVHFYPAHSKRLYNAAIKKSHILLYPIYADGWGVGLDALSLAMPIIVYDSYDKAEIVINDETGFLVPVRKNLSYLDSFYTGPYANWEDYNAYVAAHANATQVEFLAEALEKYCRRPETIFEHSRNASRFLDLHHNPYARIRRIQEIYSEILSAINRK